MKKHRQKTKKALRLKACRNSKKSGPVLDKKMMEQLFVNYIKIQLVGLKLRGLL